MDSSPAQTTATSARPINVWHIDDDSTLRSLICDLLDGEGGLSCSRGFSTAQAALEALARETPPDVILLDLHLNRHSGLDAIRPLKQQSPATHVLMLTTFSDSHTEAAAFEAGASDYLLKSYDISRIAEAVRSVCENQGRARRTNVCITRAPEPKPAALNARRSPVRRQPTRRPFGVFRSLLTFFSA